MIIVCAVEISGTSISHSTTQYRAAHHQHISGIAQSLNTGILHTNQVYNITHDLDIQNDQLKIVNTL